MNLMFWKKRPPADERAEDSPENPDDKTSSRKSPDQDTSGDVHREAAGASPARQKQRLIIAAAIVVLVLAAFGSSTWKIFLPPPDQSTATAGTSASIQPAVLPEKNLIKLPKVEFIQLKKAPSQDPQADIEALQNKNEVLRAQIETLKIVPVQAEDPQSANRQAEIETLRKDNDELQAQVGALKAELPQLEKAQAERYQADIDALTKKNSELQAQIEALRKKQPQRPSTSPASRPTGKAQPAAPGSDVAIGNKSPKTAAMTLKEAIEAMNAGSGEPAKNAAK
jgi:hypothetical protein